MEAYDQILGIETLRRAVAGMSRSLERGGRMEAHYPVALISAFFFTRDNQMPDATRNAVAEQVNALIRQKADLLEPLADGPYSPFAESRILGTLEKGISRYHVGSAGGHNVIFATAALKVNAEFPSLFLENAVIGICDLIAACHCGDQEAYDSCDLAEFPAFREPTTINGLVDNILYDLNHDRGFHGHILTHGTALLDLAALGHEKIAKTGIPSHLAHVMSCQKWKKAEADLGKWRGLGPAQHSPLTPEYWNGEADRAHDLWRGGHAFKYSYSFHEIKRAFPEHPLISCGEQSLQWLL